MQTPARQDPPFRVWENSQPGEIRNMLWGCAESGRLMNQRMVNIACAHMDFTDNA